MTTAQSARGAPLPPPIPRRATGPPAAGPPPPQAVQENTLRIGHGRKLKAGQRIGLYGPGGIGKSTLASLAPGVRFVDLEDSTNMLDVRRIEPVVPGPWTWEMFMFAIKNPNFWHDAQTVAIDTMTAAEELASDFVMRTYDVDREKSSSPSIEQYGYGKGYVYVYEQMLLLLQALDAHVRAGRNVLLIMHDCTAKIPNPASDDYIRYETRLQSPATGKSSVRHRVKEWLDHLFFLSYDTVVQKGKAKGSGTRTIYTQERSWYMAKSRSLTGSFVYNSQTDNSIWLQLFGKEYTNGKT